MLPLQSSPVDDPVQNYVPHLTRRAATTRGPASAWRTDDEAPASTLVDAFAIRQAANPHSVPARGRALFPPPATRADLPKVSETLRHVHYADEVVRPPTGAGKGAAFSRLPAAVPAAGMNSTEGPLTYDEVKNFKLTHGFWYDIVEPHYTTHDDVVYPLDRDRYFVDPWGLNRTLGEDEFASRCTDWSNTSIPQWTAPPVERPATDVGDVYGFPPIPVREQTLPPSSPDGAPTPERDYHYPGSFVGAASLPTAEVPPPPPLPVPPNGLETEMLRMLPDISPVRPKTPPPMEKDSLSTPACGHTNARRSLQFGDVSPSSTNEWSPVKSLHSPHDETEGIANGAPSSETTPLKDEQERNWRLEDFDIGEMLGEVQFGKLYLAREKQSQYVVVIKCISKELILCQNMMEPLRREIELQHLAGYLNKHILRLHAYFWDESRIFLVLQHADGGDLHTYLHRQPEGRLPEAVVRQLLMELLLAVEALHSQSILHRDIKPESILLHEGKVKLASFSCAGVAESTAVEGIDRIGRPAGQQEGPFSRRRFSVCGTWDYWAPETMQGSGWSTKSDIWAVGIVCYELLFGQTPFEQWPALEAQRRIAMGEVSWPSNAQRTASPVALSFLQALLQVSEVDRCSAAEALQHPFFTVEQARSTLRRTTASASPSSEEGGGSLPCAVTPNETEAGVVPESAGAESYTPPPPPIVVTPESLSAAMEVSPRRSPRKIPGETGQGLSGASDDQIPSWHVAIEDTGSFSWSAKRSENEPESSHYLRSGSEKSLPESNGTVRPSSVTAPPHSFKSPFFKTPTTNPEVSAFSREVAEISVSSTSDEDTAQHIFSSSLNVSAEDAEDDDGEEKSIFILASGRPNTRNESPCPGPLMEPFTAEDPWRTTKSTQRSSSNEGTASHGPTMSFPRSSSGGVCSTSGERAKTESGSQHRQHSTASSAAAHTGTGRFLSPKTLIHLSVDSSSTSGTDNSMSTQSDTSSLEILITRGGATAVTNPRDGLPQHNMMEYDPRSQDIFVPSSSRANRRLLFNESDSDEDLKQWAMNRTPNKSPTRKTKLLSAEDYSFHLARDQTPQTSPPGGGDASGVSGSSGTTSTISGTIMVCQSSWRDVLEYSDDDDEEEGENDNEGSGHLIEEVD